MVKYPHHRMSSVFSPFGGIHTHRASALHSHPAFPASGLRKVPKQADGRRTFQSGPTWGVAAGIAATRRPGKTTFELEVVLAAPGMTTSQSGVENGHAGGCPGDRYNRQMIVADQESAFSASVRAASISCMLTVPSGASASRCLRRSSW